MYFIFQKSLKLFDLYHLYCITMVLVYGLVVILVSCDMSRFNMLYYVMFQYSWYMRSGYYEFIAAGLIVLCKKSFQYLFKVPLTTTKVVL